jgi:hypothetical protein
MLKLECRKYCNPKTGLHYLPTPQCCPLVNVTEKRIRTGFVLYGGGIGGFKDEYPQNMAAAVQQLDTII